MSLSVCIPTYKRHDVLLHCLQSVMASTVRPLEIVVSDDADERELEALLSTVATPQGVTLRYHANRRGRGEAHNTRNALEQASHEIVALMHDDDFFLPGGLDTLWRAWRSSADGVDAVFGRQRVVTPDGTDCPELSRQYNARYRRLEPGLVTSNLWSALMLQFPMNGMLLRRSVALAAGVPVEEEFGSKTDLQFGVLYAKAATRPFLLIAEDASAYRLSVDSKERPATTLRLDGHLTYRTLAALEPANPLEHSAQEHALDRAAGDAVLAHAARHEREAALAIYARHWTRLKVPPATKLKLAVIVAGLALGLRWPAETLQRRRLGLPQLRRPTAPTR